jgi:hypothetical protein
MLGNGTSALSSNLVAPGANGNVLTSNGTTWTSATPAGGGVSSLNGQTGAVVDTTVGAIGSYGFLFNAANANIAVGSTIAGSSLRYGVSGSGQPNIAFRIGNVELQWTFSTENNATYPGGGTSVSGTWRRMPSSGLVYYQAVGSKGATERTWAPALWVRIS